MHSALSTASSGYNLAKVEWIDDDHQATQEQAGAVAESAAQMHAAVEALLVQYSHARQQLEQQIGKVPPITEPSALSFYMLALLGSLRQAEDDAMLEAAFLTSLPDRLRKISGMCAELHTSTSEFTMFANVEPFDVVVAKHAR